MPNYKHLYNMTDETGILQFSKCHHPDRNSGYTLDDNARALIVALSMGDEGYPLAQIYTHYLQRSWRENGKWSNLLLTAGITTIWIPRTAWEEHFWPAALAAKRTGQRLRKAVLRCWNWQ
jgi:hypothetical protein